MTWRELFRRAWLVLRLRFKRFHVCEECGDVEEPRGCGLPGITLWYCPSCEEFARLERERQVACGVCPNCGAKASGSWAFGDTAYCVGIGGCGAILRQGPALLQSQIGTPIRVSQSQMNAMQKQFAIGSAIDRLGPYCEYT